MRLRPCLVLLASLFALCADSACSQSIVFQQSVSAANIVSHSQTMGRDFWIAPTNVLFVGANALGTAYVQFPGQPVQAIAVSPSGPVTVAIPGPRALATTDSIENESVHIWSTSCDLAVSSFLLTAPNYFDAAQDGTNMLPVTAWDTDYVIAAGSQTFRATSFTIAAAYDSSVITIVPSCDVVHNGKNRYYKRRVPFSIVLMRGQSVQYEQYQADSGLTGTTVHSSRPIGVVAKTTYSTMYSAAPNLESMLPKRSWGSVYYTPPNGRISLLFIASQDSQVIRRFDRTYMGLTNYLTIAHKDQAIWLDLMDSGSRWESDAPFMAIFYTTSSGYPSVVLQPREQFAKRLSFFGIPGHGMTFTVFVSRKATFATIDGVSITQWPRVHVDSFFDCYTGVVWPSASSHGLESDQPLAAFATASNNYYQSSYALAATNGALGREMTDTIAPDFTFDATHYCTFVHVADHDSKLNAILADSISNFAVTWDTSAHIGKDSTGKPMVDQYTLMADSTSVRICLIDSLSTASYGFTALDVAGNTTHYKIAYAPNPRFFHPGCTAVLAGLDSCLENQFEPFTITLTDTSLMRVEIDNVWTDSPNFVFDRTSRAENTVPFSVYPESQHTITLRFAPTESKLYQANAFIHGPFVGTIQVPLIAVGYPWVVGPTDDVHSQAQAMTHVYPNPANSFVMISGLNGLASLELYDALGKPVLCESLTSQGAIGISTIPTGVYSYRLHVGGSIKSGMLLIVR